MDIKSKVVLVEQIAEHFIEVHLSQEIPLGIIHTGLVNILADIVKRINDSTPKPPEVAPAVSPEAVVPPVAEASVSQ